MNNLPEKNLPWRIEKVCAHAWPALKETRHEGLVLRFSHGLSRRINSANPTEKHDCDIDRLIAECEKQYRAEKLPVCFRLPSIIESSFEKRLRKRGYKKDAESLVMYADIGDVALSDEEDIKLLHEPERGWLIPVTHAKNLTPPETKIFAQIVKSIKISAAFGLLCREQHAVSMGFAAIHDGLLCFESIITAPPFRKRGFARHLLTALLDWGKNHGARGACLQVQADNKPAINLYYGLGFKEIYRYHYEMEPVSN